MPHPRLERVANVVLRVPPVVLLDRLYRWDVQAFADTGRPLADQPHLRGRRLWSLYYAGTTFTMRWSMDPRAPYMRTPWHSGTLPLHSLAAIVALCSLLLKTRQAGLLCALLLPLAARLCCLPAQALSTVSTFGTLLVALELLCGAASCLGVTFRTAAVACREIFRGPEVFQLVTLGVSLWRRLAVPLLFSTFWLVLFTLRIFTLASSSASHLLSQRGWIFIILSSVAECCSTPYSLVGLTFTVSYLALGLLQLGKLYLEGYGAFQNGNVMHSGMTEGTTLLLFALQTGLLDLQLLQRTFLLSVIFLIVVTSTLQSMIEIAKPVMLGLGASQNRSFWKHFRGVSMCLFLFAVPGFMACRIAHFFRLDFWLLILISNCTLTSLQVMGTLFIYGLFLVELFQETPVQKMDEIIYCVNAISRALEFLVAVCTVAYSTWESILGEWTWMGASVIIIHGYFNVWLRAQSGWKSFLLRWEAAKKISFLPRATSRQLAEHNDLCAICFQEMALAVIMPCSHFFHEGCLRKWFYVQDTCPLCHRAAQVPAGQGGHRG
ncbi:RING finger protein 145-like isoform X2 [Candoia aspera]|uniref:RING finger protein 145-like isoform X2 n=1 Tax=Candoia aspera TaxID=51853 RepID=UPI002FD8516A